MSGEGVIPSFPALVLNADFRPVSYHPLSLWTWQDSLKAVFLDRVNVVSLYDKVVASPSMKVQLPSVIALKDFVKATRKPPFTRYNVFLRDRFQCQYCAEFFTMDELTLDHVIPRSKGGLSTWDNVVTCCKTCNLKKSHYLPSEIHMHPLHTPVEPSKTELHRISREVTNKFFHDSWRDFLN